MPRKKKQVISKEHLEQATNLQTSIANNLRSIGMLEFEKQKLLKQVENLNSDTEDFKLELEEKYGSVTIDLATGEYKLNEDGTDTKD